MVKKTKIADGKFVNPYECANIGNDDYTTYPVDTDGNVTQVDVIENGKLFKFITPANAKARMDKQMVDNLKVGNEPTGGEAGGTGEAETPNENVPPTESEPTESEPTESEPTESEPTDETETTAGSINANVSYD